jgi:hypothetical protein
VGTALDTELETGTPRGVVGRVIQRRAAQRVNETRPQTAEIARERAERRIHEAVARRIGERLDRLNWFIHWAKNNSDGTSGERAPLLVCCSTADYVQVALRGHSGEAAMWPANPPTSADAPAALWLHRSLFGKRDPAAATESVPSVRQWQVALLRATCQRAGLQLRTEPDWLVIEWDDRTPDEVQLAQQPGVLLPR